MVKVLFLPAGPNGAKVGADDYLVEHGAALLSDHLNNAWTFDPALNDHEAEISWRLRNIGADYPIPDKLKALATLIPILAKMGHMEEAATIENIKDRLDLRVKDLACLAADVKEARKVADSQRKNQKQNKNDVVYTALLPGLVDLVEFDGAPAFLLITGKGLVIAPEWEIDDISYAPPPKEQIPWLLPHGEEILKYYEKNESPTALYDDLLTYHKGISELPTEGYYHLLAAWDFHTHLLEPCQYSPEICLFAVPERGKSRTGKGLIYVARRGVHVESLRDAYLVRLAHNFQATIFFDVMGFWKKAEKAGSEDIILGRFERGIKVPRVLYPERGAHRDTVYYEIFGPTIIATNIGVHKILDTRAIQINMPQTDRHFERDVTPEAAIPLKERLTAFRAHYLGKPLPESTKPASGRLGDILRPLLQVIRLVRPDSEKVFMELVRDLAKDRRIDKLDSVEAQILRVVDSLRGQVCRSILPVKTITDAFNEGKSDGAQFTYQRMGRKLNSLGFGKGSTGEGASAIVWDDGLFRRIFSAYGLEETSELPEKLLQDVSDISDHTDVSDVCSGTRGGTKAILFKKIHPAPPRVIFQLWDRERNRATAAYMHSGGLQIEELISGNEVEL